MFAVVKTGSKQYKVSVGDKLSVEKLSGKAGDIAVLDNVLMLGDKIGTPKVEGAAVAAKILEHKRADKIIVFKKRRRKNSKRTIGHRQHYSLIEVTELLKDGAKPSKTAAAPAPKKIEEKKAEGKKEAKKTTTKKAVAKKPAAKKPAAKKTTTAKKTAAKKEKK